MAVTTGCHSDEELARALAALRPRGDAWRHGGFDALDGSGMGGFFAGLGQAFGPVDRRVCDMVDEFFCSTAIETRDRWALDHGLPDGCDPFADVCEKVNAVGDTTVDYVVAVAQRRGWSIAIRQDFTTIVQDCSFGFGQFGTQVFGLEQGVLWTIDIDLAASPAYAGRAQRYPSFGSQQYGDGFDCPPDIEPLRCLVRRIAPAHADLDFISIS